jgi:hypothetical protein
MSRMRIRDDKFPDGFREDLDPRSYFPDEDNLYLYGCSEEVDQLDPGRYIISTLFNRFQGIKKQFNKGFGSGTYRSTDASGQGPIDLAKIKVSPVSLDWKIRYNSVIGILNGNRKAGYVAIRKNAYNLVRKMIDAGQDDLVRALDLEIEFALE